jgi:formylglycine-generating enzyme required for sulfatase activity
MPEHIHEPNGHHGRVHIDAHGRIDGVAVGTNLGTIIYGREPAEDERRRLVWYLGTLANGLYHLPLRGIEQRLDHGDGLAMPNIYILLATESHADLAFSEDTPFQQYFQDNNAQRPLKPTYDPDIALPDRSIFLRPCPGTHARLGEMQAVLTQPVLVSQAAQQHSHLVLLGDPGSGKSTFLRYLAWMLALRGLDQQCLPLPGWPNDSLTFPLILPLRALASAILAHGEFPATLTAALNNELAKIYNVREPDTLVEHILHNSASLLLLDGLDEVPLESTSSHAGRATVLRVVREFTRLYPSMRVVLTCRTRAFTDTIRAQLGWHAETLAPFTLGQIRAFVPSWYNELVAAGQIDSSAAIRTGRKLLEAITDPLRPRLREMASTPLLLTMMAIVLYNKGELPRDRPQLYEHILDLLLGQWDKVHHGTESLAEAIGKPEWKNADFLPLLDQLCYEAHGDTTAHDGRGRLHRGSLHIALLDFFLQARVPQPGEAALACLDYFEQRSGLLVPDSQHSYVFAHLTLQEHGAGRYMAVQSEDPTGLMLQHRHEDRWHEPILLGAGLLRPGDLNALLSDLINPEEDTNPKKLSRWYRDLILAAEIGTDRDWDLLRTRKAIKTERLQRDLKRGLAALLNDRSQPLSVAERVHAGFLLGNLGDPRFPSTPDEWRAELAAACAGSPTGYLRRVEAGAYTIGSAPNDPGARDAEKPQHVVQFASSFWIARYPITNAQWQAWVAQANGQKSYFADDHDLNRPNQPVVGVGRATCQAFCEWLSAQLGVTVRLPSEYEWEAAARGGDARRYPWGETWHDDRAACKDDQELRGAGYTTPVGCYPAGAAPCGALDMLGNIWEWTASPWCSYPGAEEELTAPNMPVLRGGSWVDDRGHICCAARKNGHPYINFGFRVLLVDPLTTNSPATL